MGFIAEKTLADLEFQTVLESVQNFTVTELGKDAVAKIRPIQDKEVLKNALQEVHEYVSSFDNDNRFPNHGFDSIAKELHLLGIENSYLEPKAFLKILSLATTVEEYLKFLKKFKDIYPVLEASSNTLDTEPYIVKIISKYITKYGEVDDNASILLKGIRKDIFKIKGSLGQSFNRVLSRCISNGYLDDIRESVLENQRVLAVQAMHRKKVKGSILGSSKTGSIVFIAPAETLQLQRELQSLEYEEKQEILKILRNLTDEIRLYDEILKNYQEYLCHIDSVSARAKYAQSIDGVLPKINKFKKLFFRNAYHPILFEKNKRDSIETIPQSIGLDNKQRIIVISGPNAGGKSITLKTIGLLQVMLQSGMLIPVHERSETYIFDTILTDIGDNQSIENHLSTYSYRLKNMRTFLKRCNNSTLFLIDEFGTGSDPELGGALAETFLEEFYEKHAFGIITTHYANLKLLANELDHVVNANMLFDEKTLEPKFKLFIGEAGSSFTFEVAQKNGIPYSLINRSKKKIENQKLRFDKTINKLQKQRQELEKNSEVLAREKDRAIEQTDVLEEKKQKLLEKLESFQDLYDNNQKMLNYGRKINEIVNKYLQNNNRKELNDAFKKFVLIEQSKHKKALDTKLGDKKLSERKLKQQVRKEAIVKKIQLEETEKMVKKEVAIEKKKQEKAVVKKPIKKHVFKINDTVRLIDGRANGTIEKIEKKTVFINYGMFTTKAKLEQLELVKAAPRK